MSKYIIREATDDDITDIARLRLKIKEFQPIELEEYISFWNSWVKDNPCSAQKSFVAVDNQDNIIGHYAMVPFEFKKNGKSLIGGFVCQLMVDEDFRNELLFPKMVLKMIKGYKNLGIDFLYSLSNRPEVVRAHQAFGFRKIGVLSAYAKPFRLKKIAHHLVKSKMLQVIMSPGIAIAEKVIHLRGPASNSKFKIREISKFNSEIDRFIMKFQKHFSFCILRNSAVLNWRIAESSARKYRILIAEEKGAIAGYLILRRMKMKQFDVLAIVDILFSPKRIDIGKMLLNTAHRIAIQLNVDISSFLSSTHDPLFPILRNCGYYKTPETFSLFLHEPKGSSLQFKEDSFDKWHLTWLDHDSA